MFFAFSEYLLKWIGNKTISKYGAFQFGIIEGVSDGDKHKIYLPKIFTDVSDELRGTIDPPLKIYNMPFPAKQFSEIKYIG
jgi:hypothetical protein